MGGAPRVVHRPPPTCCLCRTVVPRRPSYLIVELVQRPSARVCHLDVATPSAASPATGGGGGGGGACRRHALRRYTPCPAPCLTRFALSLLSGVPSALIPRRAASLPPTYCSTCSCLAPAPPRPRGSARGHWPPTPAPHRHLPPPLVLGVRSYLVHSPARVSASATSPPTAPSCVSPSLRCRCLACAPTPLALHVRQLLPQPLHLSRPRPLPAPPSRLGPCVALRYCMYGFIRCALFIYRSYAVDWFFISVDPRALSFTLSLFPRPRQQSDCPGGHGKQMPCQGGASLLLSTQRPAGVRAASVVSCILMRLHLRPYPMPCPAGSAPTAPPLS